MNNPLPEIARDVWAEINSRPSTLRPFGSALPPHKNGEIIKPMLITEPTKRVTRPEIRALLDGDSE